MRGRERDLEKSAQTCKAKTGVGCDGLHSKVPLNLTREKREELVEFLEKVEQREKWKKWWSSWRRWNSVGSGRNKLAQNCSS